VMWPRGQPGPGGASRLNFFGLGLALRLGLKSCIDNL